MTVTKVLFRHEIGIKRKKKINRLLEMSADAHASEDDIDVEDGPSRDEQTHDVVLLHHTIAN